MKSDYRCTGYHRVGQIYNQPGNFLFSASFRWTHLKDGPICIDFVAKNGAAAIRKILASGRAVEFYANRNVDDSP